MEFRRIPFQFSATDPAKRQAELQKRFGIPCKGKMHIDLANPGQMGSRQYETSSASSSPRLQHRVPIFTEGLTEASEHQPNNVDVGQKQRVRVVPIEIEGADKTRRRHRNSSGPPGSVDDKTLFNGNFFPGVTGTKHPIVETEPNVPNNGNSSKPRVYNVPIQIEGDKEKIKELSSNKASSKPKQETAKQNASQVSKANKAEQEVQVTGFQVSLKKIEIVMEKLAEYQADVEKFSGTAKEKQYRYLDEMLTRCMLDLDNVDTMGNDKVRLARKAAIKEVQSCIDLLESKLNRNSGDMAVLEQSSELSNESSAVTDKMQDVDVSVGDSLRNDLSTDFEKTDTNELNKSSEELEIKVTDVEMEDTKVTDDQVSEMLDEPLVERKPNSESMEMDQDSEDISTNKSNSASVLDSVELSTNHSVLNNMKAREYENLPCAGAESELPCTGKMLDANQASCKNVLSVDEKNVNTTVEEASTVNDFSSHDNSISIEPLCNNIESILPNPESETSKAIDSFLNCGASDSEMDLSVNAEASSSKTCNHSTDGDIKSTDTSHKELVASNDKNNVNNSSIPLNQDVS